ncbi:MAG: NUDIX hydrolase [Lachnospiraceae bacterium]|nr:NUDIX hydrolase [Lachnospiraceae bacterium]
MELWDAYDSGFNKIEGVILIRGEKIPDGMFHLVCDVIVRHIDGSYLIMQRDFRKHYGGMWEATAGGSALKGEVPLECAVRELREETGIIAKDISEVGRESDTKTKSNYIEYLCVTDWNKNDITLQDGETVAYKWVSKEELISMKNDELVTERMQRYVSELSLPK